MVKNLKNNKNVVAIIPARGGSKSIPRKNIINFCGKPLIAWTIEQALQSKYIKNVHVSTDCNEIAKIARRYGAQIIFRPAKYAKDTSSSEDVLLHALSEIEKINKVDLIVFLQATSPIRNHWDINAALERFNKEKADSLFSASIFSDICLWKVKNKRLKSVTFDYRNRLRRQERAPYYLENGSIYVFKPGVLHRYKNRLGGKIVFYPMEQWKSFEIDSLEDIFTCSALMKSKILNIRGK